MEKALKIINELQEKGLIKNYAIGGGIAAIFYIEPVLTYDLDIFFNPSGNNDGLLVLASIYDYLKNKGYSLKKEHILIENIPVQFLPVYNKLVEVAVMEADEVNYKDTKTRILKAEYLIAIMLQTYRPKDRERIVKFLEESDIDKILLEEIVEKFNLRKQYDNFMRLYHKG